MADCDWLRSTFSCSLISRNRPVVHYEKQTHCKTSKLNVITLQLILLTLLIIYLQMVFSRKEIIHWCFFVLFEQMCTTPLICISNYGRRLEDMNQFYLLVVKTIFYSFVALIRKILFPSLEDKIHIFAPPCNILYIV